MSSDEEKSLLDLPSPILLQILSTFPPTTLLYRKSVSKSFLNLTLDSEFTKLSRSTSPASIIISQFNSNGTNTLKFLKFVVDNFDHDPNDDLDLKLYFPVYPFFLVGSVHGFVCFNYFFGDVDSIYILNPRTREYVILPEPQGVRKWPNLVTYGFGFRYYKSEAQVYTIGIGYWRSCAGDVMFCFGCRAYGVNLYVKIHWLVYDDAKGNESICSFDLENELFESFPTAPMYNKKRYWYSQSLGVFGRCLCVFVTIMQITHFEVWVMKEYRVTTSSWVKEIVINISPECNDWLGNEIIYMLKVLEDGEVCCSCGVTISSSCTIL